MISILTELPSHVAGFVADGQVTKEDYENVLIPRIDAVLAQHGHIHFLLELRTDVSNFTAGAWWSDAAMGLKHFSSWKKMAIVSDQQSVEKFSDMFSALLPGKTKGFSLDELEAAKIWVASEEK